MSIQMLFLTVIGSGLFLLFVIGFLILNAIEKKPLWSSMEFEVTGFDEDFDKVPFSGRFYCNQVNRPILSLILQLREKSNPSLRHNQFFTNNL